MFLFFLVKIVNTLVLYWDSSVYLCIIKNKRTNKMNISISKLEKNCKALTTELELKGFKVELDVFKSGNSTYSRGSYVEMIIEKDDWSMLKILANGYGAVNRGEISTSRGWALAKEQILASIK